MRSRRLALALAFAIVGGCSVDVSYPVGLACLDGQCPGDQICFEQRCVTSLPTADAAPDSAPPIGRTCGGSEALVDEFSDNLSDWWVDEIPEGSVSVAGAVIITLPISPVGGDASAFSAPRLDLTESHWFARVSPALDSTTTFGVQSGAGEGSMLIKHTVEGTLTFGAEEVEIDYDSAAHQYWGFREMDGLVHYETSPDGLAFVSQHSEPVAVYTDRFQAVMSIGRGVGGDESVAQFDDLNTSSDGSSSLQPFCAAELHADDFEDGQISEIFSFFAGGCDDVVEAGGRLIVPTPASPCVLVTTGLHDLVDSAFEIELAVSPAGGSYIYGVRGKVGAFQVDLNDGVLNLFDCPMDSCGPPIATVQLANNLIWRFRGENDLIHFEVSVDGGSYTRLGSSTSFDSRATRAFFNVSGGNQAVLERFN